MSLVKIKIYSFPRYFNAHWKLVRAEPGEEDLTCQSRDCVRAAASRTLERWGRPDWRRSSVGWSWANERRTVPPGRKAGSCLLTAGASVVAESGRTERVISAEVDVRI